MSWSTRVIDELVDLKAQGLPFEAAWESAMEAHRPGRRERGADARRLFETEAGDPFEALESIEDFTRRVAADAWMGERPALAHLHGIRELLNGLDESKAARRLGVGRSGSARIAA